MCTQSSAKTWRNEFEGLCGILYQDFPPQDQTVHKNFLGTRVHILSDNQTALKRLKTRTFEEKTTWHSPDQY